MMKKLWPWLVLAGLILTVGFYNRWIFDYKFEPEYWENYYYTSQWNVPNSKRVIADEGVYRYIGYRLVNGENPFNIDYWVPPMGKYWYGVGAKYLGNPYLISAGWYLLSILMVGLLGKKLFKEKMIRWLAVYLWTINPLIVEQIGQTMLDLPMTVMFLVHVYCLFGYVKGGSIKMLAAAGMFLGLMAGTKPAYFVPMIGIVDWWLIWQRDKALILKKILWFTGWIVGGYVLAYSCYFIKHPNPIPWIRLHEKIINFQKGNGGSHDILNIFKTIFLDRYKGFWVGGKVMVVTGWSLLLPAGTLLLGKYLISIKRLVRENLQIAYLTLVGIGYGLMNLTIDFWPRYLVMLMPILVLVVVNAFKKKPIILGLLILSYLPWLKYTFWPNQNLVVSAWNESIAGEHYRETYRLLSKESQQQISEKNWLDYWKGNKKKDIEKTLVKENNQWRVRIENGIN